MKIKQLPSASSAKGGRNKQKNWALQQGRRAHLPPSQRGVWKRSLRSASARAAGSALALCSRVHVCLFLNPRHVLTPGMCLAPGDPCGHRNGQSQAAGSGTRFGQWLSEGCSDIPVPGSCVVPRSWDGGSSGSGGWRRQLSPEPNLRAGWLVATVRAGAVAEEMLFQKCSEQSRSWTLDA